MKSILVILFSVVVLMLAPGSCGRSAHTLIETAESIIEDEPHRAYKILDSIDGESLNRSYRMKHGLLLTQAKIKTYVHIGNDSLISCVADYYSTHGSDFDRMKSLFYQGYVRFENKDYHASIMSALPAYEMAVEMKDDYWRAKTAELLADIFVMTYKLDALIHYRKEAVEYYEKAGKILNHLYAWCDLGIEYAYRGEYERGITILDSIARIAGDIQHDSILFGYCYKSLIAPCFNTGKYDRVVQLYEDITAMGMESPPFYAVKIYNARAKIALGDVEEGLAALKSLDSILPFGLSKSNVYLGLAEAYTKRHEYEKAVAYMDSMAVMDDKIHKGWNDNSVGPLEMQFYKAEISDAKTVTANLYTVLLCVTGIGAAFILVGVLFHRQKMRLKSAEIDEKMNDIAFLSEDMGHIVEENRRLTSSLKDSGEIILSIAQQLDNKNLDLISLQDRLSESDRLRSELAESIERLFKGSWKTFNMLCNEYFEKGGSDKTRASIIKDIEAEIKKLQSKQSLRHIEDEVNKYMGNIVAVLREECLFLKEDDITFITLVYAGFSPRAVCLFTGIKYKYFYSKRERLYERIMLSDVEHKDLLGGKLKTKV